MKQTGKEWTEVLEPTILLINSTKKRSIQTTPFEVMFGRQSNHNELIRHLFREQTNLHAFNEIESHTFNESIDTDTFNENYPYQDDEDNNSKYMHYCAGYIIVPVLHWFLS